MHKKTGRRQEVKQNDKPRLALRLEVKEQNRQR